MSDTAIDSRTPTFSELPTLPESNERHAWDVWGRQDQLGSVNRIGPDEVAAAARLVNSGKVVSLSLPLDEPNPGLFPNRTPYKHVMTKSGHGRDDRLDGLYPQFSSQFDGLRHVRFRNHGYWGGRQDEEVDNEGALGIERWAQRGLIGRGVLLDVRRHYERTGRELAPDRKETFRPDLLDEVAAAQGVRLQSGDIVIVRPGWTAWYLSLVDATRLELHGSVGREPSPLACPGLDAHQETAAWLWDRGVAVIASDNVAVEALPVDRGAGFLHYRMIPLLGLVVGEFWYLEDLSRACADTGRYEFLFMAGVMNLPGGVGSPANAYAVL